MGDQGKILFTAFEPSGDAMAAPLIEGLRREHPHIPVAGFGGPRIAEAGAELIENTTEHAVMLLGALAEANRHRTRLAVLARWLAENEVRALVPVDSPAANWSICRMVRRSHPAAKIVHLVAPQLWAWAPWRIRKLRRLTDHVMCMLPFEPAWFEQRGVRASFVGHPVFDEPLGDEKPSTSHENNPRDSTQSNPTVALLPGSRTGEIRANLPACARAILSLRDKHPALVAKVCASDDTAEKTIHDVGQQSLSRTDWQKGFEVSTGSLQQVLHEADVACVVSGTVTLSVAKMGTPMVAVYHVNRWAWTLLGRWLVRTRTFTLPNLIAEADGRPPAVPELIPHHGAVEPLARALDNLLSDPRQRKAQRDLFAAVAAHYEDVPYHRTVLERFRREIGLPSPPP